MGFSKRTFAEWGSQVKTTWIETEGILNKFKTAIKTAFIGPQNDEWKKLDTGEIVDETNIDDYIPILSKTKADKAALRINDIAKTAQDWQGFYSTLGEGEEYIVDLIKNTEDLTKLNGDDLVKANKAAREAVIQHNIALKQQTLSAKAAAAGIKLASITLNTLVSVGISMLISVIVTKLYELANAAENAKEAAENAANSILEMTKDFSKNHSDLSKLNDEYQKLAKGTNELGENVSLTSDQYDRYKEIVGQVYEIMPNLATRFNAQGEAISFAKGELSSLNEEYEKYMQNEAKKFLSEGDENGNTIDDILYGYNRHTKQGVWESIWNGLRASIGIVDEASMPSYVSISELNKIKEFSQEELVQYLGFDGLEDAFSAIFDKGDSKNLMRNWIISWLGTPSQILDMTDEEFNEVKQRIIAQIESLDAEIDTSASRIQSALITSAYSKDKFWELSKLGDGLQDDVATLFSSITDDIWYALDIKTSNELNTFVSKVIDLIGSNKDGFRDAWNNLFDLNSDSMSYADYQSKIDEYIKTLAKGLGLVDENGNVSDYITARLKIAFNINTENITDEALQPIAEKLGCSVDDLQKGFTEKELTFVLNTNIDWSNVKSFDDLKKFAQNGLKADDKEPKTEDSEDIKKAREELEDLARSESLEAIKHKFDVLEQSINKITDAISLLDSSLDLLAENDYLGKIDLMSKKFDLAQDKTSLLRNEFAELETTEYNGGEAAQELATRMKNTADSIFENQKSILEYGKSIAEYYTSALNSTSDMSSGVLDEANKLLERNIKSLSEGGLMGFSFALTPIVSQSAVEKQRKENEALASEMQRYYDKAAEMQKIALDLQYQEIVEDNAKKRKELEITLGIYKDETEKTNDKIVEDIVETGEEIVNEANTVYGTIIDGFDDVRDHIEKSPIKFKIEVDDSEVQTSSKNYQGTSAFLGNSKKYLGTQYVWGGKSQAEGLDCSGFVALSLKDSGYDVDVSGTNADGLRKYGKQVYTTGEKDLQEGDILFFDYNNDGVADHVGIYLGDGKMRHSSGGKANTSDNPGKGVVDAPYSMYFKDNLMQVNRLDDVQILPKYASGTASTWNGVALVGDDREGKLNKIRPELIVGKNGVYLAGTHGAEFVSLNKGDQVIPYEKTKEILARSKNGTIPRYATGKPIEDPNVLAMVKSASEKTGVPANVLLSVIDQESGNQWTGKTWDVNGWSYGYMQLHDPNGELTDMLAKGGETAELARKAMVDPYTNILVGAQTYKRLYDKYGNWADAASAYNQGEGGFAKYGRNKYGNDVWNRANSSEFLEMAKNIGAIATNTSDTVSAIQAAKADFPTKLEQLYNGSTATSTDDSYSDNLLDYIEENIQGQYDNTEKLIANYEALEAFQKEGEKTFADFDQRLLDAVGTPEYDLVRQALSEFTEEYNRGLVSLQVKTNTESTKEQFKFYEDAYNLAREFYDKRKAEGASADELTVIVEGISQAGAKMQEASDAYVEAVSIETEYLNTLAEREGQKYRDDLSWKDKTREDLERQLDDTDNSVEKANLLAQLIANDKESVEILKAQQKNAHAEMQKIRADEKYKPILDRFDTEAWHDANGDATAQFAADLELMSQTMPELVPLMNQFFELESTHKKSYYEAAEGLEKYNDSLDEYQNTLADLKFDTYIELQDRLAEILEYNKAMNDAITSAKEQMYDFQNTLREEENSIRTILRSSRHVSGWLDKDTREQLFNLNDYKAEMKVIKQLQSESERLYRNYRNEINSLAEEEAWKEAEITAEYNKQVETLKDKLDIAKQELDVAKKEAALENALRERDTQIIMGNRMVNVHDPDDMYNKAEELSQSELQLENQNIISAQNEDIRDMQRKSDSIDSEIAAINNRTELLNNLSDEEKRLAIAHFGTLEEFDVMLKSLTKANIPYLTSEDNTHDVYNDLDFDKTSHGYTLGYNYEGHLPVIDDLLARGVLDAESADKIRRAIEMDHDYKTTTDPRNAGYNIHNPYADFLNSNKLMQMFDSNPVLATDLANMAADAVLSSVAPSYKLHGTVISGEGAVIGGSVVAATATDNTTHPATEAPVYTESSWDLFMASIPRMDTSLSGIKTTTDNLHTLLSTTMQPTLVQEAYESIMDKITSGISASIAGAVNAGSQDNSVHNTYTIENIEISNPIGSVDQLMSEIITKTQSMNSITNNMR